MYIPHWFREERLPVLHDLIRRHPFAPMITEVDGAPFATHLPFLLDPDRGAYGVLRGHMARSNPQWRGFTDGKGTLVIFQGPHAYISTAWYAEPLAVPTWNYATAHVYGAPQCVDEAELRQILLDTVRTFETAGAAPLPADYFEKMMRGVVGFEVPISRIEGKFKLSQNRSDQDRHGVVKALSASAGAEDRATAECMRGTFEAPRPPDAE